MITALVATFAKRLADHRRYSRMVAEIASLTQAELIDMGAFQVDLYRAAREQVYG